MDGMKHVAPEWIKHVQWVENEYLKGNKMENKNAEVIKNIEILRGMIEAYPEASFNLHTFKNEKKCGTLYCSVGLAACQPYFKEKGLALTVDGGLTIHGQSIWSADSQDKLDEIFGEDSFEMLFSTRNDGKLDKDHPEARKEVYDEKYGCYDILIDSSISDKQLALWRIDHYLKEELYEF